MPVKLGASDKYIDIGQICYLLYWVAWITNNQKNVTILTLNKDI